jgi:multidrug efflux pump
VATSLLSTGLFLLGALAFPFLPLATLPEVEYPTITVFANLPGASPETMASAVATPLERMFGRIAGITQMTSNSQLGSTNITMQFDLSRNVDDAGRDVQAAINAARGELPANLPMNPNWRKVNPAGIDIVTIALTSDTATTPQLYDVAESILVQKISQIPGVGQESAWRLIPFYSANSASAWTKYVRRWERRMQIFPRAQFQTRSACSCLTITISFF